MAREIHIYLHRDSKSDPPYVRARENETIGMKTLEKEHEKRTLAAAVWQMRNGPKMLSEEQKALLRKHGKMK